MTVTEIAKKYGVATRSIQRLLKANGCIRTVAEANKVTAKLKNYDALRIPDELKSKRKTIPYKLRYKVLANHPYCKLCGNTAEDCTLHIDHVDGNPSNNVESNLQVLCIYCNTGKK